jgi:hypothetical protein
MKVFAGSTFCPRCDSPKMKSWSELTDEEKMLVEKLPISAEIPLGQRKKHRFCTRCWFEDTGRESTLA